jgi:hypothetical protein
MKMSATMREGQLKEAQQLVLEAAGSDNTTTVCIVSVTVDVTNFESLQKKASQRCGAMNEDATTSETATEDHPGPPTLLLNCAGFLIPLSFADLSPYDFAVHVNINYLSSIHIAKYMEHDSLGGHLLSSSVSICTFPCTFPGSQGNR